MKHPPSLATRLLRAILPHSQSRDILGDMEELFHNRAAQSGDWAARRWYWRQALSIPLWHLREEGTNTSTLFWQESRLATRSLLRKPGFTFITVLTLALAIGANTAIFSVVDGVLLESLPFPQPDRLMTVGHTRPGTDMRRLPSATGIQEVYAEEAASFEAVALYRARSANLNGTDRSERITIATVTPSIFDVLQAEAVLGRAFTEEEGRSGAPDVIILSHGVWANQYGMNPDVLGSMVRIDGVPRQVVGVMGEDFAFPNRGEEYWIPLLIDPVSTDFGGFNYQSIARLTGDVSPESAARELESLFPILSERFSYLSSSYLEASQLRADVHPYINDVVGNVRVALWVLMATVGLVLLIACANVANLFLARAEGRQKEVAVRTAIGAGRGQLTVRFMTESGLLVAAGGVLGVILAYVGLDVLKNLGGRVFPRVDGIGIDGSVLTFTAGVVLLATLVFGTIPGLRHRKVLASGVLRDGTGGAIGRRKGNRARKLLVASQVAMALVLLVGSALMAGSFRKLQGVDPGFEAENVLTFRIPLPEADYPSWDDAAAFHQELLDRLHTLPGVEVAGAVTTLPLSGRTGLNPISVGGRSYEPGTIPPIVESRAVTPGYFQALGIPLSRGRMLERTDAAGRTGAVLLSQSVASTLFDEEEALGRTVAHSLPDPHDGWSTVVGVVGDVHSASMTQDPMGILYFAIRTGDGVQKGWLAQNMSYAVKTSVPPLTLLPAVRNLVADLDTAVPVADIREMNEITRASQVQMAFSLLMIGVAAGLGLILALVGLYGVVSYLTVQRTREIGVRVALGAKGGAVQWMVIRQGMGVTMVGLGVGLLVAYLLSSFMEALLFGVEARDPSVFASVTVLLATVSLAATWLPAFRAARIDPTDALRSD